MREITPKRTPELDAHCKGLAVWKAPPFEIKNYRALVEHVARLAYANPDELLFFRGQDKDYQSKAGGTTLYPAIYRGDSLPLQELDHRFEVLEAASKTLVERFKNAKVDGHREMRHKKYIQWSILQHYEVVSTPLLDLTQSLRVACSFAQLRSSDATCFIYVFGLPYLTNRISINSEHDLVNIRLLSICPPKALRPYFQEGFLAGTTDVTSDFDTKTELDFRNRLIAKFAIPRAKSFWGSGFDQIPETALFPKGDEILAICDDIKTSASEELQPGELGNFVSAWSKLEQQLLDEARRAMARNVSTREAILHLSKMRKLTDDQAGTLDWLRRFRNQVVHRTSDVNAGALREAISALNKISAALQK